MSKNKVQKYFPGNFVRHKTEGWFGVIYAMTIDGNRGNLYALARFHEPLGWCDEYDGLYWEEILTNTFDIIPYPWQEFFKVGDEVKNARTGDIGTIMSISCDDICPIEINDGKAGDLCDPIRLIKVGEA